MGSSLPFAREIGCQHDLSDRHSGIRVFDADNQAIKMNFIGAHAIEGREASHQYKVIAFKAQGLLDHDLVGRGLHNTEQ